MKPAVTTLGTDSKMPVTLLNKDTTGCRQCFTNLLRGGAQSEFDLEKKKKRIRGVLIVLTHTESWSHISYFSI